VAKTAKIGVSSTPVNSSARFVLRDTPKVKKDKALVIVMRKSKEWGLPNHRNIIKYKGPETRGGFLTDKARRKIEKRLGL